MYYKTRALIIITHEILYLKFEHLYIIYYYTYLWLDSWWVKSDELMSDGWYLQPISQSQSSTNDKYTNTLNLTFKLLCPFTSPLTKVKINLKFLYRNIFYHWYFIILNSEQCQVSAETNELILQFIFIIIILLVSVITFWSSKNTSTFFNSIFSGSGRKMNLVGSLGG